MVEEGKEEVEEEKVEKVEEVEEEDKDDGLITRVSALEEQSAKILKSVEGFRESLASFVENGGVVQEGESTGNTDDAEEEYVSIDDLDLSLEDK